MSRKNTPDHSRPMMDDDEFVDQLNAADPSNDPANNDEVRDLEATMEDAMDGLLPNLPPPPGYRLCWLSTTHERDFLGRRERMGYTPCLVSEMPPGVASYLPVDVQSASEGDGMIRVREMVLYKIPEQRWEAIMQIQHHKRPNELAAALDPRANPLLQQVKDSKGTPLVRPDGEGMIDAMRARRAPSFLQSHAPVATHKF